MIARSQFVVALIAAFLFGTTLGVLTGIVGARYVLGMPHRMMFSPPWEMHRFPMPPRGPGEPGGPGGPPGPPSVVMRLERVLDLTPAQRDSIAAILSRSHGRFDALRDSLHHEIEAQLTPKQKQEWLRMQRRMEPRRGHWPHDRDDDRP